MKHFQKTLFISVLIIFSSNAFAQSTLSNTELCKAATKSINGKIAWIQGLDINIFAQEAFKKGLDCNVNFRHMKSFTDKNVCYYFRKGFSRFIKGHEAQKEATIRGLDCKNNIGVNIQKVSKNTKQICQEAVMKWINRCGGFSKSCAKKNTNAHHDSLKQESEHKAILEKIINNNINCSNPSRELITQRLADYNRDGVISTNNPTTNKNLKQLWCQRKGYGFGKAAPEPPSDGKNCFGDRNYIISEQEAANELKGKFNNYFCEVLSRNNSSFKTPYSIIKNKYSIRCNDNSITIASNQNMNPSNRPLATVSDSTVCYNATTTSSNTKVWNTKNDNFVGEANYRGLDCGVKGNNKTVVASKIISKDKNKLKEFYSNISSKKLCYQFKLNNHYDKFVKSESEIIINNEVKLRGLDCGVGSNKTIVASKPKTQTYIKPKSTISSAELDAANKRASELERKLAALENKQKQEQQKINKDNQIPTISAFTKQNGSNAIISGRVTDNREVAEVLINGQSQQLSSNGTFETKFYIPRAGKTVEIVAFDTKGNKASKLLKIERGSIAQASGPVFDTLNPSGKRVKSNPNALALIIGVADYEKTNADALYADKDAQQFYDYATMKLGIKSSNIKELVNDKADLGEILINVKDWLRRSAKPNKSDIYIYFAGHGLASDDGTKMYLLPYDGRPRLLENTAVLRDKLFTDLSDINPRSVTVFLDTCYSGTTRGTDMLVASRPIMIKAKEQSIPNNFTVFSAAAGDQTSKPLEEAKHGMFSYFLMKGMEGDADTNADNKITAQELHNYVKENVTQQSSGSQTPELQGDKDRVLVQFN